MGVHLTSRLIRSRPPLLQASPLRILLLEDVPMDAELLEFELRRASVGFVARRVDTREYGLCF